MVMQEKVMKTSISLFLSDFAPKTLLHGAMLFDLLIINGISF